MTRSTRLSTIGFDADDTLWQNERFFRLTEERFTALLAPHAPDEDLPQRLLAAERRNLSAYGFGIKGFVLSMIETAIEVTDGAVPARVIGEILGAGREMMRHPVETLPHVHETLERLSEDFTLVLVTKGDLFDQERKLAASGLGAFFDGVEIVSAKTADTYRKVFSRHGEGAQRAMMVGNSLKSDICPAIEAGAFAVHVPHELTWVLEHETAPQDSPRFFEIDHLGELQTLVERLR
ncbi:HAD family hydrolase [Consotaella salsifontis]|uniref:Putative hydrolase of the HAD superfamily n=1 Tax=Consotaella salsifontis TaxID=1365950 RepID=A0A1T4T908_9HYPH|nr:HAD family hydrolase [Consotaella salsifontis]SKA36853.1 putative hydrolase of the HAD superfamily [Consotaella salsifontis]